MPLIPRFSVYRPASRNWDAGPVSLFSLMTCLTAADGAPKYGSVTDIMIPCE